MKSSRENSRSRRTAKVCLSMVPPCAGLTDVGGLIFVEYGKISKMLGNGRVEVQCFDNKTRICKIRGKMRKKVCPSPGL